MIFGHAPIIFPAVLGGRCLTIQSCTHRSCWEVSLVLRLAATGRSHGLRQWGGLLNALAILFFLALLAGSPCAPVRRIDKTGKRARISRTPRIRRKIQAIQLYLL